MKKLSYFNTREKQALKELIGKLKSRFGTQLRDIILFGSKARGDFDDPSDIDIFLIFSCDVDWKFKDEIHSLILDIDLKHEVFISARIYSAHQLEERRIQALPFIQNVQEQGVSLL